MWSTVGSAGTVDLADVGKVIFAGSVVQLPGIGPVTTHVQRETGVASPEAVVLPKKTVRIRYDVTPDAGVNLFSLNLKLLYRSGEGQVVAKLVEVGIPAGPESVVSENALLIFDSNDSVGPDPEIFQARVATSTPSNPRKLDFANNAYYVELSLIAPAERLLTNPPAVSAIQIFEHVHQ
jgi:hypothetical protein